MNKNESEENKETLEYILGSIQLVFKYLKGFDIDRFYKDVKIQDAVSHRIYCIGKATGELTQDFKSRYVDFPWSLLWALKNDHDIIEFVWDFAKGSEKNDDEFDSLKGYFRPLEQIYFKEYYPEKAIPNKEPKVEIEWSTDYKYPTKAKDSIWTVKKK